MCLLDFFLGVWLRGSLQWHASPLNNYSTKEPVPAGGELLYLRSFLHGLWVSESFGESGLPNNCYCLYSPGEDIILKLPESSIFLVFRKVLLWLFCFGLLIFIPVVRVSFLPRHIIIQHIPTDKFIFGHHVKAKQVNPTSNLTNLAQPD